MHSTILERERYRMHKNLPEYNSYFLAVVKFIPGVRVITPIAAFTLTLECALIESSDLIRSVNVHVNSD